MVDSEQQAEFFARILSSISDHIYVMTLDRLLAAGHYAFVSPQVERLTGYPAGRFVTEPHLWPSLIHPDDSPAFAQHLASLQQHARHEIEYRLMRADGQTIWVRDSAQTEPAANADQTTIYGLVSDITQRRRATEALTRIRDKALETSRFKSQIVANVSHDLRTPLSTIWGYAQLLEIGGQGPLNDKQRATMMEIKNSAQYLSEMINNLLDQARLEDGKLKLNLVSFVPSEIVNQVQANMAVPAHAKGLNLSTDIDPNVPLTVTGDPNRVRQILANLVTNAVKFTNQGTVRVRLFRPNPGHWALQVSDTGLGIAPEDQSYIFEPFRQVENNQADSLGGSGLGLSIVKQLTTLMGGHITLESQPGQGSTFTIFLPLLSNPNSGTSASTPRQSVGPG